MRAGADQAAYGKIAALSFCRSTRRAPGIFVVAWGSFRSPAPTPLRALTANWTGYKERSHEDHKLQEDLARPVIYHLRAATWRQPEVKGLTMMTNSQYNGWRSRMYGSTNGGRGSDEPR